MRNNAEHQITFFDLLPFSEVHGLEVAADPCLEIHLLDGGETPGVGLGQGDGLENRIRNHHGHWRGGAPSFLSELHWVSASKARGRRYFMKSKL